MATITTSGSVLDINSIVNQLMTIEQQPIQKLNSKEASYQSTISALGSVKGTISAFQNAVAPLLDLSKFAGIKASSSQTDYASVSAKNGADVGTFALKIEQLARVQRITSGVFSSSSAALQTNANNPATDVASATITITKGAVAATGSVGGTNFTPDTSATAKTLQISPDADGKITLSSVRDAINKQTDLGVTASIVQDGTSSYRLVISGANTGEASGFKIDVEAKNAGGAVVSSGLSQLAFDPDSYTGIDSNGVRSYSNYSILKDALAQDSKSTINGLAITSKTNTLENVVNGLTITLKKPTDSTTSQVDLTVGKDGSSIATLLGTFVKAYNEMNKTFKDATAYDPTTKTAAILQGDATVNGAKQIVRGVLNSTFGSDDNVLKTLSSVGLSFGRDGSLSLDTTKLNKAVAEHFDDVVNLFGAYDKTANTTVPESSKTGLAYRLNKSLDGMLAANGMFASRVDNINKSIKALDTRRADLAAKLVLTEARYRKQYSALDTMLASMQSTSNALAQQLANLPKASS